jgi:hypothetical protein
VRTTLYTNFTVARQGKHISKHLTDWNLEYIRKLCKSAIKSQEIQVKNGPRKYISNL